MDYCSNNEMPVLVYAETFTSLKIDIVVIQLLLFFHTVFNSNPLSESFKVNKIKIVFNVAPKSKKISQTFSCLSWHLKDEKKILSILNDLFQESGFRL